MQVILISSRESFLHSSLAMLALSGQIELEVVLVSFGSCQHEPPLLDTGPVRLVAPSVGSCLAWACHTGSSSFLVRPVEEGLMGPCDIGASAPSPSTLHTILHMAFMAPSYLLACRPDIAADWIWAVCHQLNISRSPFLSYKKFE